MKFKVFIFISLLAIFSCNNDEDSNVELIGTWELIEVLVDPGDGSGVFQPTDSNKTIQFNNDKTLNSNSYLCSMFSIANEASTGEYNEQEQTIFSLSCNSQMVLNYQIENNRLIINHFCIEACAEKYIKIN